jgi:uncharacterized membrane protein
MESTIRVFGHSMHPILIVFPLGLLSTSVIFDILFLALGNSAFPIVAYWMIVAGIVGGLAAASTGWVDWFGIPSGTRAKRIGLFHGVANACVLLLFAVSLYFRHYNATEPTTVALALSFAAFAIALVGGWLGGELVERLAIAVHTGAHPDAPSSLSADRIIPVANSKHGVPK